MSKQIQDMIERSRVRNEHKKTIIEPLIPTPFPDRPWQAIGLDIFKLKSVDYLVVVDIQGSLNFGLVHWCNEQKKNNLRSFARVKELVYKTRDSRNTALRQRPILR